MIAAFQFLLAGGLATIQWTAISLGLALPGWAIYWYMAPLLQWPDPFSLERCIAYSVLAGLMLLCCSVLAHVLTNRRRLLKNAFGRRDFINVDSCHPMQKAANKFSSNAGVEPVKVYAVNRGEFGAFAAADLFDQVILIDVGAVANLPTDQLSWMIAHEVALIRNGHAAARSFWIDHQRFASNVQNAVVRPVRLLGAFLIWMRMPEFLGAVILAPLLGICWVMSLVQKGVVFLYKHIDGHVISPSMYAEAKSLACLWVPEFNSKCSEYRQTPSCIETKLNPTLGLFSGSPSFTRTGQK